MQSAYSNSIFDWRNDARELDLRNRSVSINFEWGDPAEQEVPPPMGEIMQSVIDYVLEHKGGTFDRDLIPFEPRFGYAVGMANGTAALVSSVDAFGPAVTSVLLAYPEAPYIGLWLDADGNLHVDPVLVLANRQFALLLARDHHQKAIYNFATKNEEVL